MSGSCSARRPHVSRLELADISFPARVCSTLALRNLRAYVPLAVAIIPSHHRPMSDRLLPLLIMIVSASCLGGGAIAATPPIQAASPQVGSSWAVAANKQECHLARKFVSEGKSFWVDIIKGGGPEQLDLLLLGDGVPKVRTGYYYWLSMASRGQTRRFSALSRAMAKPQGNMLLVKDIPSRMFANLETVQTITFASKETPFLTLEVAEAKEAFGKLQECYANLLKSWNWLLNQSDFGSM